MAEETLKSGSTVPEPPEGSRPEDGHVAPGATDGSREAGVWRALLPWSGLMLAPLGLILGWPLLAMLLWMSDPKPLSDGQIELSSPSPTLRVVAAILQDGRFPYEPLDPDSGIVLFTDTRLNLGLGIGKGVMPDPTVRLWLSQQPPAGASPAFELAGEPVFSDAGSFQEWSSPVRLGDVLYAGTDQDLRRDGTGFDRPLFQAAVYDSQVTFAGEPHTPMATTSEIVIGASVAALLKANARDISTLTFVEHDRHVRNGVDLSAEDWIDAIREAVERAAPHLDRLRTVLLLVDPNAAAPDPSVSPEQQAQQQASLHGRAQIEAALAEPAAWTYSLASIYFTELQKLFGISLPWENSTEVFTSRSSGTTERPPREGPLPMAELNPAYRSSGRVTFLPALALLASVCAAVAWSIRKERPTTPGPRLLARGALMSFILTFGFEPLPVVSRWWWTDGLGVSPLEAVETALALGGATAFAVVLGLLSGRFSYRTAHPASAPAGTERTPEPSGPTLRSVLYPDIAKSDLRDDKLGFAGLVEALAGFLDNRQTEPPVVLAINGPWGSGKSSIMRMLTTRLEATQRFRIAWFNAWQYQKEEQILAAFLKTVAAGLAAEWGAWLSLRLAWLRLKEASFLQLVVLSAPFLLLFVAWQASHWLEPLAGLLSGGEQDAQATLTAFRAGTSVTGLAGLLWLARFLWPFRLSYRRLFAVRDESRRVGFLDAFQREFRLYRQAAGREKFLIVIDDLDRCHPDAVAEVLKTINLIVTSDPGVGKTFFLLGFDSHYVVRSLELHFKEFAAVADVAGGRFGPQYLKKIVTLQVSVPDPDPSHLESLVAGLSDAGTRKDPGETAPPRRPLAVRAAIWAAQAADGLRRPFPLFALFVALVVGLALFGRDTVPEPTGPPLAAAGGAGGPVDQGTATPGEERADTVLVSMPQATDEGIDLFDWIETAGLAMAILAMGLVLVDLARSTAIARRAPPEPEDARAFVESVIGLKELLPHNPRDVVRLVNRMRVFYLIQEQHGAAESDFTGAPLRPDEAVLLTALQETRPELFDPGLLERLIERRPEGGSVLDRLERLAGEGAFAAAAAGYRALATALEDERGPGAVSALTEPAKLRRFLVVNRHLLRVLGDRAPPEEGTPAAATEESASPRPGAGSGPVAVSGS